MAINDIISQLGAVQGMVTPPQRPDIMGNLVKAFELRDRMLQQQQQFGLARQTEARIAGQGQQGLGLEERRVALAEDQGDYGLEEPSFADRAKMGDKWIDMRLAVMKNYPELGREEQKQLAEDLWQEYLAAVMPGNVLAQMQEQGMSEEEGMMLRGPGIMSKKAAVQRKRITPRSLTRQPVPGATQTGARYALYGKPSNEGTWPTITETPTTITKRQGKSWGIYRK